ncbi:MAG: hypothetical protein DRP08_04950 [Candidatus Aenigmatarchaeota archaeon]|nr:MAG: hypothetical protein DRP08_04950 [Candidatus Aenigmarchaeota archaeon]
MPRKKNKKKRRFLKVLKITILIIANIVVAVAKTIFIDLFKNLKQYIIYAVRPEEKERIKMKLTTEKTISLINERLQRLERLVYSIFEDPEYTKRKEGKYDIKELKKEVQK